MNWRRAALAGAAALAVVGVAQGVHALQQRAPAAPAAQPAENAPAPASADSASDVAPGPTAHAPSPAPHAVAPLPVETPMAKRVAVLGLLNKRNGIAQDVTMKPGDLRRIGDVVLRLRACDKTAPWEPQTLTGAFVQTDVRGPDGRWRRVFSGWLFKESPSLNSVQDPIYDVWVKSCAMTIPDSGPDTIAASSLGEGSRSSAKKSAPAAASGAKAPSSNTL
jgi:hypothetical protein